ncbi:YezD family protein [Asticcacaulis machinosus]|uniref:YezD family protein n=1 Tax=Asticcacaulis machinosus TaxID=2984211 RepID=A0ABT5HM66_9CAUL|nr:YezD family protein [Asticcacaulis machinosus]MDC7677331.1 YezD family protein [Asticcacaulis machinosus]
MSQTHAVDERLSDAERHILQYIQEIKYGSVEILIHDSRIVQIERSEKLRFDVKRPAGT